MTRYAWTGAKLPAGGFTDADIALITNDVAAAGLQDGDEVGSGLCDGVDEEIMLCADALRRDGLDLRLVGFPPAPQYRRRISQRAWAVCDEMVETDADLLGRDRRLIEWADQVRAIPRYPCERRGAKQQLFVTGLPRSGTGYTIRRAEEAGKLASIVPMRRAQLKTAGVSRAAARSNVRR